MKFQYKSSMHLWYYSMITIFWCRRCTDPTHEKECINTVYIYMVIVEFNSLCCSNQVAFFLYPNSYYTSPMYLTISVCTYIVYTCMRNIGFLCRFMENLLKLPWCGGEREEICIKCGRGKVAFLELHS